MKITDQNAMEKEKLLVPRDFADSPDEFQGLDDVSLEDGLFEVEIGGRRYRSDKFSASIRTEVRALINQRRKLQFLRDSTQQAIGMIARLEQDLEHKLRTKQ